MNYFIISKCSMLDYNDSDIYFIFVYHVSTCMEVPVIREVEMVCFQTGLRLHIARLITIDGK